MLSGLVASILETTRVGSDHGGGRPAVSVRQWMYDEMFASWAGPTWGSLLHAVAFLALWWAAAAVLDRRGWYLKV